LEESNLSTGARPLGHPNKVNMPWCTWLDAPKAQQQSPMKLGPYFSIFDHTVSQHLLQVLRESHGEVRSTVCWGMYPHKWERHLCSPRITSLARVGRQAGNEQREKSRLLVVSRKKKKSNIFSTINMVSA